MPVYTIHDIIEPFDGYADLCKNGEFYINKTVIKTFGVPLKLEAGFYSRNLVLYLVDVLNMPIKKIKWKITTKRALAGNTFRNLMIYIFKTFPENQAKKLANSFIGELGRKYLRTDHGFACRDMDTAQYIWTSALAEKRNITIDNYKDLFLIRERTIERHLSDNTSVNRFVISEAILQCLKLISDNWPTDSELYSVNTDGFFMTNPKNRYRNKSDVKFKTKNIGKAFITNTKPTYFEKHYRENIDVSNYTAYKGNGAIYYAPAGCGRTRKLCMMISKAEDPIVLSFTNKAIEVVKSRIEAEYHNICHTFDSYFCDFHGRDISQLNGKPIFTKEFSMTPSKWMTKIYHAFTKYHNTVYLFGDTNQCSPMEEGSRIHDDYMTSIPISEMCPRRAELKYIENCSRYDTDMLTRFLDYGVVEGKFQPIGQYYRNICYLNKTRRHVTAECCERFTQDKDRVEVSFKNNSNSEQYKVPAGMPVLVTRNIKKYDMFNTMEFKIKEINEIIIWLSFFAMRLVNLRSVTCYTDQNF